jgi:hypothetical protein
MHSSSALQAFPDDPLAGDEVALPKGGREMG